MQRIAMEGWLEGNATPASPRNGRRGGDDFGDDGGVGDGAPQFPPSGPPPPSRAQRAVPPMPRKLRPKPRARQGNSHFVGPKFYADWNEFDADLDKWEDERAARMRLMAKRHKAQQRVFEAKHPGKR